MVKMINQPPGLVKLYYLVIKSAMPDRPSLPAPMDGLPPRPSMATYAADIVRRLLDAGEWRGELPGERPLSERVGVSRPTLHRALRLLEKEGRLAWRRNAPWVILDAPAAAPASRRAVFLSPYKLEQLDPFSLHQFALLSNYAAERGLHFEIQPVPSVADSAAHKVLEALQRKLNPTIWILYRCSPACQRWFVDKRLPAVVMGSAPKDLPVRSVDVDYRAAGRHAMSVLRRLGHRPDRITYIGPEERLVGNVEAEAGLAEGDESGNGPRVRHVASDSASLIRAADEIMANDTPTALVVMRPMHALAIMGHLGQRGVRIPKDLSLLILDDNPILRHAIPVPSRYVKNALRFSTLLRRALDSTLEDSGRQRGEARMVPELEQGETVGPPAG